MTHPHPEGVKNVAGGKREARNPRFAKCCKVAHAEGVQGNSSQPFRLRRLCKNEPGVARFALTPGYIPFTPSG
jgi:hypothetical protein